MTRGLTRMEKRLLVGIISVMRDKIRDEGRDDDDFEFRATDIGLHSLYERCYHLAGDRSYELQRRNQRQSMRRALGRLHEQGYIGAQALAWVNVADGEIIRWQGGGSLQRDRDGYRHETPRWRLISLTESGLMTARVLEREGETGDNQ
jgi:hypothetical protein